MNEVSKPRPKQCHCGGRLIMGGTGYVDDYGYSLSLFCMSCKDTVVISGKRAPVVHEMNGGKSETALGVPAGLLQLAA